MLTFSHHNLLDHTVTAAEDVVSDADEVKSLFQQFGIKTHISGPPAYRHISKRKRMENQA